MILRRPLKIRSKNENDMYLLFAFFLNEHEYMRSKYIARTSASFILKVNTFTATNTVIRITIKTAMRLRHHPPKPSLTLL